MIHGQILIVAPQVTKGLIEGRLSFLALITALEIFSDLRSILVIATILIVHTLTIVIASIALEGRVVVHLSIDTVHKLRQGKFHQRGLQQLLMGKRLSLLLLL